MLLFWGLSGLPPFGHSHGQYGRLLNAIAVPQRHTTNVVTSIVFDYRGVDTLGEEFILFTAVVGVVLLLRYGSERERTPDHFALSPLVRLIGGLMVGTVVLTGLWLIAFGAITPGGGFQGGVVVAGGLLVVYLARGYRPWERLARESVLDPLEGFGVGSYVALGLGALIAGLPFLQNLLGPGKPGTLVSGGSVPFLNWATAIEVVAANVLLYAEFLEHYLGEAAE